MDACSVQSCALAATLKVYERSGTIINPSPPLPGSGRPWWSIYSFSVSRRHVSPPSAFSFWWCTSFARSANT